ncbi:MAG: alpha/beta hydrolase [Halieaceae bacterium]|nr:alpha/beta hydrolase [Halieaceae bacterium]
MTDHHSSSGLYAKVYAPGVGSPVLLLHSLALDHQVWDEVATRLAQDHTVITPDLRGHGRSAGEPPTSLESMSDDLPPLLQELCSDEQVILVGMSLGGCVAQALAARHPQWVRALVLADTTCWYGADAPATWAVRAQKAVDAGLPSLGQFQRDRWFTPHLHESRPERVDQLIDIFVANDVTNYQATCHAMGAFDYRETVSSIKVPTAILVGEDDYATPVSHAEDLQARINGSTLQILSPCAHLSAVEQPDAFIAAIARLEAR